MIFGAKQLLSTREKACMMSPVKNGGTGRERPPALTLAWRKSSTTRRVSGFAPAFRSDEPRWRGFALLLNSTGGD
jgi:hypothetical protein